MAFLLKYLYCLKRDFFCWLLPLKSSFIVFPSLILSSCTSKRRFWRRSADGFLSGRSSPGLELDPTHRISRCTIRQSTVVLQSPVVVSTHPHHQQQKEKDQDQMNRLVQHASIDTLERLLGRCAPPAQSALVELHALASIFIYDDKLPLIITDPSEGDGGAVAGSEGGESKVEACQDDCNFREWPETGLIRGKVWLYITTLMASCQLML